MTEKMVVEIQPSFLIKELPYLNDKAAPVVAWCSFLIYMEVCSFHVGS